MPHQTEPNANNALGDLLRGMMPGCEIRSENTQTFVDQYLCFSFEYRGLPNLMGSSSFWKRANSPGSSLEGRDSPANMSP